MVSNLLNAQIVELDELIACHRSQNVLSPDDLEADFRKLVEIVRQIAIAAKQSLLAVDPR